jgi:hypothetical protein
MLAGKSDERAERLLRALDAVAGEVKTVADLQSALHASLQESVSDVSAGALQVIGGLGEQGRLQAEALHGRFEQVTAALTALGERGAALCLAVEGFKSQYAADGVETRAAVRGTLAAVCEVVSATSCEMQQRVQGVADRVQDRYDATARRVDSARADVVAAVESAEACVSAQFTQTRVEVHADVQSGIQHVLDDAAGNARRVVDEIGKLRAFLQSRVSDQTRIIVAVVVLTSILERVL